MENFLKLELIISNSKSELFSFL